VLASKWCWCLVFAALVSTLAACSHGASNSAASAPGSAEKSGSSAPVAASTATSQSPADAAPPASETGGFDGAAAYDFTAKLVSFGPRPPASDAIHRTQDYLIDQLKGFGCAVDTDDFHASTPIGSLAMKNIIAKAPGTGQGIILLLTHYDTLRKENFVGANDGGSSTGLMLEMAKILCGTKKPQPNAVWIAFLDGEEALVNWDKDNDNTYGSRELAARMAIAGEIKRVRAVILADMVGPQNVKLKKESNSTPWLARMVWKTAATLGYQQYFVAENTSAISDDHLPFLGRDLPAVDIIDLSYPYWHTTNDTIDKLSPRSLAIVGHVILETVNQLQQKFH
jgi:hypothetical protein